MAFDEDTALTRVDGRFHLEVPAGWRVGSVVNGGYLAAVMTRALVETVDDPARQPRSVTLHYLRPCRPGSVSIHVDVERRGSSLCYLSGRLTQGDSPIVLGLAAFGVSRPGLEFQHEAMPDAPTPDGVQRVDFGGGRPWFTANWDYRPCIGHPRAATGEALTGGWLRPAEPRPLDAPLVAAMSDAWLPSINALLDDQYGVPSTVDLTLHLRRPLPLAGAAPDDFVLAVFRSRMAVDGYWEEDGVLWSEDGRVLAQVRQMKLLPVSEIPDSQSRAGAGRPQKRS